jgi:hypothetical protein
MTRVCVTPNEAVENAHVNLAALAVYGNRGCCCSYLPRPLRTAHGPTQVYRHNPRFPSVDLGKQPLPGMFEHAVHHLLEHTIDLSAFDARFGTLGRRLGTRAIAHWAFQLRAMSFLYKRPI